MKRLFVILLALCLSLSFAVFPASAETVLQEDNAVVPLSSLDNEECKQFLLEQGVVIPEEFSNLDFQELFANIEKNPDIVFVLGWTALGDFLTEVRDVVNVYYGYIAPHSTRASTYTLQYSTLHLWDPATMPYYNCYAYVLGRTSTCHPGNFSGQTYNGSFSITTVAQLVKDDLNGGLGYDCVKVQSSRPSSTNGWENVIAVRKDTDNNTSLIGNDYHFAMLTASGWYHKPGKTAILRFINAPTNSEFWTNEYYDGNAYGYDVTYDSNILYLSYKSDHGNTSYVYTGEHYHSGSRHYYLYAYVCNNCGDRVSTVWTSSPCSGPPCVVPSRVIHESEEN